MRSHTSPQRLVERARIVLNPLEGRSNAETCALLSVSHPTVTLWLDRYEEAGVEGLVRDRPRSGRPKRLDSETVEAENVRALARAELRLDFDARCRCSVHAERVGGCASDPGSGASAAAAPPINSICSLPSAASGRGEGVCLPVRSSRGAKWWSMRPARYAGSSCGRRSCGVRYRADRHRRRAVS
jgi:transposase